MPFADESQRASAGPPKNTNAAATRWPDADEVDEDDDNASLEDELDGFLTAAAAATQHARTRHAAGAPGRASATTRYPKEADVMAAYGIDALLPTRTALSTTSTLSTSSSSTASTEDESEEEEEEEEEAARALDALVGDHASIESNDRASARSLTSSEEEEHEEVEDGVAVDAGDGAAARPFTYVPLASLSGPRDLRRLQESAAAPATTTTTAASVSTGTHARNEGGMPASAPAATTATPYIPPLMDSMDAELLDVVRAYYERRQQRVSADSDGGTQTQALGTPSAPMRGSQAAAAVVVTPTAATQPGVRLHEEGHAVPAAVLSRTQPPSPLLDSAATQRRRSSETPQYRQQQQQQQQQTDLFINHRHDVDRSEDAAPQPFATTSTLPRRFPAFNEHSGAWAASSSAAPTMPTEQSYYSRSAASGSGAPVGRESNSSSYLVLPEDALHRHGGVPNRDQRGIGADFGRALGDAALSPSGFGGGDLTHNQTNTRATTHSRQGFTNTTPNASASDFSHLPSFSATSFVRAYVSDVSLSVGPAVVVTLLAAALNIIVVIFLQNHVLDTRDHLGLFLIGSYLIFSSYYMVYYFLERFSSSFRRIGSQDKKFYIIGNLLKAGILVSITPFAFYHLTRIILFDIWEGNILRNLGCIYAIPDFISMIIVKRMRWSTWIHHLCVVAFNYFSIMNDYQQENVCRCVVVYAAFSSFAYCVNVLLASRFLGVSVSVARVLSFVALVVYVLCCAINWIWQVYYLRRLVMNGNDHWTVYVYMGLICLVMWDDVVLNKWLLHHAKNTAFAAAQQMKQPTAVSPMTSVLSGVTSGGVGVGGGGAAAVSAMGGVQALTVGGGMSSSNAVNVVHRREGVMPGSWQSPRLSPRMHPANSRN